ncbi:hypothetical protein SO802_020823 [Lithocarpus litseifolius]|uniref:Cyclic nucleotide-binding domain-containing protein n=1 Tax=Lithocarpus litseifolius TaxID=425828 RepID=A0AAW2CFI9_9ROSI
MCFVLDGIVEIASACPMLMDVDPSTIVLDDDELCCFLLEVGELDSVGQQLAAVKCTAVQVQK